MNQGEQYKNIIDPFLKKVHKVASLMIDEGSKAIDIACGNGTLAMKIAEHASDVTAIDLSDDMIDYAKIRAGAASMRNMEFILMDAKDLSRFEDKSFDYATISMAVHQFSLADAFVILKEMKRIAKEIVIIDYAYPLPGGLKGAGTRVIERIAGVEHNNNFREYLRFGGLPAICKACDLELLDPEVFQSVFSIVRCK